MSATLPDHNNPSIGIKKGTPFEPDERMKEILTEAVAIGNAIARTITFSPRKKNVFFYEDRKWNSPFAGGSHEFFDNGERVLDDRSFFHYYATGITPAMTKPTVGQGSVYAILETDQKSGGLDSKSPDIKSNDDGSYTVWFGPEAPKGQEGNWIQTLPDKSYNVLLRLYGPLEPWFDKTWKPGDFELVN